MKNLQHVLFAFCLLFLGGFAIAPQVQAATYDVCAAGCDFTRIEDAFNSGLLANDIVTVGPTYDLTGDNSFLAVPAEVTLNCENSGAVIGSIDFYSPTYMSVGASSTVINCSFVHARVIADNGFGATIQNNTLGGNSELGANNAIGTTIEDNEGTFVISAYLSENTTILNNTLSPDVNTTFGSNFITVNVTTGTAILSNDLITNAVNDPFFRNYIYVNESDGVTIQDNFINQESVQQSNNGTGIFVAGSSHVGILDNRIYMSGIVGPGQTMIGIQLNGGTIPTIADILHNTIKMDGDTCNNCAGIAYTNWSPTSPITVIAEYNLIAGSSSSTADQNGIISYSAGGAGLSVNQAWMGFAGLRRVNNSNDVATGPDAVIMNGDAAFRDEDASPSDDWELAPYSNFLDIDGTEDAGAISGVRGNSFTINQAGPLDYVVTHALDTTRITQHVRTGDTLNFAGGTYSPVTLTQGDRLASNVILNGSGPTTIIEYAGDQGSALSFNGISNSIVNGLTFSGSTVTTTYVYTLTKALYSFGGNDYNEAGNLGVSPTTALLIGPGCAISAADGPTDITTAQDINATDWNIALVQAFGFRLVAYVPNSVASSGAQLNAQCGFTIDAFVNSAIISQGNQIHTYDAAAIALAGVTLLSGESAPEINASIQQNALISNQTYSLGGTSYTESTDFGATTEDQMLLIINPCIPLYVNSPSTLTRVNNPTNSNWNLLLIEQGGFHATVLAPETIIDNVGDLAGCGAVNVDAFVEDVFIYNNGGYTFNAAAVALAGITLNPGQPNPPFFVPIDNEVATAGIFLMNSTNNTFLFSTSTNNDNGIAFVQSSGNNIVNSAITSNNTHDLVSLGDLENTFQDVSFDPATSIVSGDSGVTAYFSARVLVQDGLANPLDAMNVTLSSANNATTSQMVTDITGLTPYVIFPGFRLSSTDITETAGGFNPQLIQVDQVAPFFGQNVTSTLNTPFQTFTIDASIEPVVIPVTPTSIGGGAMTPVEPSAINDGRLALVLDRVEKLGDGLVNIWVRLNGNPYTVRGFSLSTDPAFKNTALQNLQEVAAIAVSNATGKVTIYGRYFSTTGEASETYSLTVDLASGIDIPTVPTTPSTPGTPGESNQCFSSPFTRDLQTGAVAEDVRQLQIFLNAQGFALTKAGEPGSKGFETTRFGAATRNALKAFQKANKLSETGILSGSTRTLVQNLSQKAVTCKNAEKFTRDLKAGMTSDDVKVLQQYLNAQGFTLAKTPEAGSKGFETRFFGRATFNALKAFQKANILPETGIFSGATRAKANESKPIVKMPTPAEMSPFMKYTPWVVR